MEPRGVTSVQRPGKRYAWKAANLVYIIGMAFGSLSYGYTTNVIASTLAQPTFIEYFRLATRSDAESIRSAIVAMYYVGGFLSAFILGSISDRLGRKWAVAVACIIVLLSGALQAGSVNVAMFIVFRFFAGIGGGMIIAGVPIWMTEVSPVRNRGALVNVHAAFYLTGFMVAGWVGYGFYFATNATKAAWRGPIGLQCLPPALLLSVVYWVPESPRWLLLHDRRDEARQVLLRLHDSEEATAEFMEIEAQMQIDKKLSKSFITMVQKPSYRKRLLISCGTMAFNQFSGILVITNYGPTIYASLGYDSSEQLLYSAAFFTVGAAVGILAIFIIDLLPRPKILMIGLFGCAACLSIEAALVATFASDLDDPNVTPNEAALRAAIAMFFIYVIFFNGFLDGTQWVYVGELWPNHMRGKGMSTGMSMTFLMNIIFTSVAPTAFKNIEWRFYLVFIVPSIFMVVLEFLYWPETRNVPLEEVAAVFGDTDQLHQLNLDDLRAQGPEGPKEGIAEKKKKIDDSEHTVAQEIETVPNPVRN